jgi:carbonic anhydrase
MKLLNFLEGFMIRMRLAPAFLLALPLALTAQSAPQSAPWSYSGKTGPAYWPKLSPDYAVCGEGHEQSPIDIRGAHLNKALKPITFGYIASPASITNNGHTIEVTPAPGSYILFNDTRYDLIHFDFHRPSEHTVKGKLSDMEIHLLHKSAEGKLLVLSVRINEGNPNAVIAYLWAHLPQKPGETEKVSEMINPGGMLPVNRAYWTYKGSLTAPPCTEGVRWIVFEDEKELSRDQIKVFSALFKFNSRTLQNPHGRKIEAFE